MHTERGAGGKGWARSKLPFIWAADCDLRSASISAGMCPSPLNSISCCSYLWLMAPLCSPPFWPSLLIVFIFTSEQHKIHALCLNKPIIPVVNVKWREIISVANLDVSRFFRAERHYLTWSQDIVTCFSKHKLRGRYATPTAGRVFISLRENIGDMSLKKGIYDMVKLIHAYWY